MKRVFVVDDEPDILNLVNIILTKNGYEVEVFSDGASVLQRLKTDNPDLILLDMIMPKINGIDVVKTLKKDSRTAKIPIIVFSALAKEDNIEAAFEAGCDRYIKKPFVIKELLDAVRTLSG